MFRTIPFPALRAPLNGQSPRPHERNLLLSYRAAIRSPCDSPGTLRGFCNACDCVESACFFRPDHPQVAGGTASGTRTLVLHGNETLRRELVETLQSGGGREM